MPPSPPRISFLISPFRRIEHFSIPLTGLSIAWFAFICVLSKQCLATDSVANRPNIILINLDDADRDMFRPDILRQRFPAIDSIANQGIVFTNFHVTTPLCGPSRACLLRGQYAHSINHRTNEHGPNTRGFRGDLNTFVEQGYFDDDMGMWMKQSGYQTIFVGKYINYIEMQNMIPKGWDDFYRSQGSRYYGTSRFTNRHRPQGSSEKLAPGVYRTNAEADDVVRLINLRAKQSKPLFVYFAPFGPHTPGRAPGGMIDHIDQSEWKDLELPIEEDYDEADLSDKPFHYQQLPELSDRVKRNQLTEYRKRMLAVRSVDRAIHRIVESLKQNNMLQRTYIFITSDNGFSLGQHRMNGKGNSMTRSSHVPLVVFGPGIRPGQKANHLLAHIDLAPTLLDLAGRTRKPFHDGKSFAPLLSNPRSVAADQWRSAILIENWQSRRFMQYRLDTTFCQLRSYDSVYTEWADGSREYYDLQTDPLELNNCYSSLSLAKTDSLSRQLKMLRKPLVAPIVTIDRLQSLDHVSKRSTQQLVGVAEDSSGVAAVQLAIRNEETGRYWNGVDWQTSRYDLTSRLKNPCGIQSEWTYELKLPRSEVKHLSIALSVIAVNGNQTTFDAPRRLHTDKVPPVTVINNVRFPPSGKARIFGHARDNDRVSEVRLHLQNLDSGLYFDGKKWVRTCECIHCQPGENDRWEVLIPRLQNGRYVVRARAYDFDGNFDPRGEEKTFDVRR